MTGDGARMIGDVAALWLLRHGQSEGNVARAAADKRVQDAGCEAFGKADDHAGNQHAGQ